MIYLDTHAVVWLFENAMERFTLHAQHLMESHDLLITPIVQLELGYLFEVGRIQHDGETIVQELSRLIGLQVGETPFADVVRAALPMTWTRDPFDRLIVAGALCENAPLLTRDESLQAHYAKATW